MVSVTGNALVCIIIVRHRRMRTVTNYCTLNLAVADLAVTCIYIPFDIPVQENDYRLLYGGFLCRTLYPLQTMAMFYINGCESQPLLRNRLSFQNSHETDVWSLFPIVLLFVLVTRPLKKNFDFKLFHFKMISAQHWGIMAKIGKN